MKKSEMSMRQMVEKNPKMKHMGEKALGAKMPVKHAATKVSGVAKVARAQFSKLLNKALP